MKAPDKIYVEQKAIMYDLVNTEPCKPDDLVYISKDALIEWLLKGVEASEICKSEYGDACAQAYQAVIDKLNSM